MSDGGKGGGRRPLIGILLAVGGAALVALGFYGTIGTALATQTGVNPLFPVALVAGAAAVLAAIVMAVGALRGGGAKGPWIAALLIALVPVVALLALAVASAIS